MPDSFPSLWDYAVELYSQPEVRENCLRLQDEHAWNVNLLLACVWYGQYFGTMTDSQCRTIHSSASHWNERVVSPLRQLRRWLKTHIEDADNIRPDAESLRESVKKLELAGERQLLKRIEEQLLVDSQPFSERSRQRLTEYINSNLALLGEVTGAGQSAFEQDLLNTIVESWRANSGFRRD